MRRILLAIAICALLLPAGCKNKTQSSDTTAPSTAVTAETNLTPEQLGELGAQIKKQPGEAKSLLSKHGLTEESFEHAIRKVSEDPKASKRYAAAYKRASA